MRGKLAKQAELQNDAAVLSEQARRSVVILGATGSIGRSTADIIANAGGAFDVVAVAGGRDPLALARVARELGAGFAALADASGYAALKEALSGTSIEPAAGPSAVVEAALLLADIVMGAIAGPGRCRLRPTSGPFSWPHSCSRQERPSCLCRTGFHSSGRRNGDAAAAGRQRA